MGTSKVEVVLVFRSKGLEESYLHRSRQRRTNLRVTHSSHCIFEQKVHPNQGLLGLPHTNVINERFSFKKKSPLHGLLRSIGHSIMGMLETACSLCRYQIVLIIYCTIKNVDLTVV